MVFKKSLCCLITNGNQCTVHVQMFFSQRWEHSVDSQSSRCIPTYYSCSRKALPQNSHRVSEPSKKTLLSFEDCEELIANSWLITSVASFTNETWSVRDDNECIHYSSPLGLRTDQYTGPIKNHRSWMLKLLASGQANKVPLRNWDGWIPVSLMVNPCIAEENFVCVFEG